MPNGARRVLCALSATSAESRVKPADFAYEISTCAYDNSATRPHAARAERGIRVAAQNGQTNASGASVCVCVWCERALLFVIYVPSGLMRAAVCEGNRSSFVNVSRCEWIRLCVCAAHALDACEYFYVNTHSGPLTHTHTHMHLHIKLYY